MFVCCEGLVADDECVGWSEVAICNVVPNGGVDVGAHGCDCESGTRNGT